MGTRFIACWFLISFSFLFFRSFIFPRATLAQETVLDEQIPYPLKMPLDDRNVRLAEDTNPTLPFASGRVLVKFREGLSAFSLSAAAQQFELRALSSICDDLGILSYAVRPGTELATIEALRLDPAVEFVEPDYFVFATPTDFVRRQSGADTKMMTTETIPNDSGYFLQWALPKINAPRAWDLARGSGVTIAILDSGVDLDHPDLAAKIVSGYDFINDDADADDDNGHGTHVAGIAAAISNNALGVAGLAWDAKIMPIKVLNRSGVGPTSALAHGICWAANHGADVINMSLSSPNLSNTVWAAIDYANSKDIVSIAAAGNEFLKGNTVRYPGALNNVRAVAATDNQDAHASFSNTGVYVDIAAPGVGIISTYVRNQVPSVTILNGTSMATPLVSGLAALVLSVSPDLSPNHVMAAIHDSAVDLGDPGRDVVFGYGRIDAAAALTSLEPPTPPGVDVQSIAAGADHTCALTSSGGVRCWGDNSHGQLGDGTTRARRTPVNVNGLSSGVQYISAGDEHTCALTSSGGVKCWGDNSHGQLGDSTPTDRLTPVDVNGLASGVQYISAGADHTCALTISGDTMCWGRTPGGDVD